MVVARLFRTAGHRAVLLSGATVCLLAVSHTVSGATPPSQLRPNILLVVIDNLGKDWFGCYGSEEGDNTPTIDDLAEQGIRFATCYSTPYCSTARVMLMTGRYPFRTGWVTHHDAGKYGGGNFDWTREITFVRQLRAAGYATAISGKWQLNLFSEQPDALLHHGFDEHCIWPDGLEGQPGRGRDYWDMYIKRNGAAVDTAERFGPDIFADFSTDFIRRHRDRPFFLYHSMILAHTPPVRTPRSPDANVGQRDMLAAMVRYVDHIVGRLVATLDELELRDRTIIVVTSDNGTNSRLVGRINGKEHFGGVGTLWERGIDVPFIVNCPGRVPGGRVVDDLIDFTDILPTLLELAVARMPAGRVIDGRSFARTLLGIPGGSPKREWIHTQYHDTRVVRDRRYKLYSTGHFYDLKDDWLEEHSLNTIDDSRIAAARRRLQAVLDRLPADAPLGFEPQSSNARALRRRADNGGARSRPPQRP